LSLLDNDWNKGTEELGLVEFGCKEWFEMMVGILLLMHEPLAGAFKTAVGHLFGDSLENFEAIDVKIDQNVDDVDSLARQAIQRLDSGSGVLVFTDMLGGTPANCCRLLKVESTIVQVLAGTSLPMLLRALTYRKEGLEEVIAKALQGGKNGAIRIDPTEAN
jgi:PTS system ascorbate-specific IIA component